MKKKSKFKKYLLIYSFILLLSMVAFISYIYIILINYEFNNIDNFLLYTINNLDNQTLSSYLEKNNLNKDDVNLYKDLTKSKDYKFKKIENNIYEAYLNDNLMFTIVTKVDHKVNKFGLLNYDVLKLKKITPSLDRGLVYYNIIIPSNYKLYVDNTLIENYSEKKPYPELDYLYNTDFMPYMLTYHVDNLNGKEKIKVIDFTNHEVELTKDKNNYLVNNYIIEKPTYQEANEILEINTDILSLAKKWSLFLTNDLEGNRNGFDTIQMYLAKNTDIYTKAKKWSSGVDIQFTSKHTLQKNTFTNEKLTNFKIYDNNLFSCEVYLEKHMKISGVKEENIDIMHDTIYFIKDETWKVINIRSLGDE